MVVSNIDGSAMRCNSVAPDVRSGLKSLLNNEYIVLLPVGRATTVIHYGRKSRFSAKALAQKLEQEGYNGPDINFGLGMDDSALNKPKAVRTAVNKREALIQLEEAGVPIPKLYLPEHNFWNSQLDWAFKEYEYPIVGRRDYHARGSGFFVCYTPEDFKRTRRFKRPPSHYLQLIENAREFRVHIVGDRSIKISEKVGGGLNKNHSRDNSVEFIYPYDFNHKITLRKIAKQAIDALELDFGAVDILYKDGNFYVLEVNTAPCLTDTKSDTLDRYAQAFMDFFN